MLMKIRRAAAAVALIAFGALAAAPASAATFNFTGDFFGSIAPDSPSKTFTVDGITVTVTAGTFSNASNPSNINFANRLVDLDFFSGLGADGRFDGDNIDGRLGNDVLVFSFSRKIIFENIRFRNRDGNDDFAFGAVTGSLFDRIVDFEDVQNTVLVSAFATMDQAMGRTFGIGAIQSNDNFTIRSIEVAAVPIPAALPLFLSGLLGMGWLARRRRKSLSVA